MSRNRRRTRPTAHQSPSNTGPVHGSLTAAALSGAVALFIYLATAARDIVVGDPTEFVLVAMTGGVPHAPGYPLLAIVGRVFGTLPLDPPAFRVNLVSVLMGAASVALIGATARRLGAPMAAAITGALVFATAPVVWRWSLVAEAFPLNDLLVAAMLFLLIVWDERPSSVRPFVAVALFGGLALANHQMAALVAPAVALAAWQRRRTLLRRPMALALATAAFAAGLLPYAYIPVASAADPRWNWGGVSSLADLWDLITRQSYGASQLVADVALRGGSAAMRVGMLLASYWPLEAVLVLAGAISAFAARRDLFWRTLIAFALAGPVFIAYADIDPAKSVSAVILERFFLLPHLVTAPLTGLGVGTLMRLTAMSIRSTVASRGVVAAILLAAAALAAAAYPSVDRRGDRIARGYGLDILASVEQGTVLLTVGDDTSTSVAYLQLVEHARRDVTHVVAPLLRTDWYVDGLKRHHPDLVVPFDRLGGAATLRTLIEANPARTFASAGGLVDDSLRESQLALHPRPCLGTAPASRFRIRPGDGT